MSRQAVLLLATQSTVQLLFLANWKLKTPRINSQRKFGSATIKLLTNENVKLFKLFKF